MDLKQIERELERVKANYHYRLYLDSLNADIGTSGSGNWGHAGRKGIRGGSAPGGGKGNRISTEGGGYTSKAKQAKAAKRKPEEEGTIGAKPKDPLSKKTKVVQTEKGPFGGASVVDFTDAVKVAKATQPPEKGWRVSSPDAKDFAEEHPDSICHITPGGSVVAVTSKGDIVSFCKKYGDPIKARALLQMAREVGGDRLDSYDGNHGLYRALGFEPCSWCKWDDGFATADWLRANKLNHLVPLATSGKDEDVEKLREELAKKSDDELTVKREDIIFYRYTGNEARDEEATDYKKSVPPCADYMEAQAMRDSMMENGGK